MVNKVNKFVEAQNLASVLYKLLFILLIIFFLGGCGEKDVQSVFVGTQNLAPVETQNLALPETQNLASVRIGGAVVRAEVAENLEDQIKGLSGRKSLGENNGMLFVYNDMKVRDFWMKDMEFPLDIIFVRDNIVVDLVENLSMPKNDEDPLSYTSKEAADYVLEVSSGFVDKHEIEVGNKVDILW